ncbi:hypothetical protein JOC34_003094 [Virgibacillus halotolerans]|nr:hypothetical protein [Virgibacillus halotolerans]
MHFQMNRKRDYEEWERSLLIGRRGFFEAI